MKNDKKNDGKRIARVEKEVQSIVSTFIIQKLQAELPGFVTIGRVQIPADLRQARIYVSLMSLNQDRVQTPEDLEKVVKILQYWAPDIQEVINQKIQMKYLPKLTFFPDESTEKILKIENILLNLNSKDHVSQHSKIEDDDIE